MGVLQKKKNYNNEKHKDYYSYILRLDAAINFIKDISPYLIINSKKKKELNYIKKVQITTPRNGIYSEELLRLKEEFYEEFMDIK